MASSQDSNCCHFGPIRTKAQYIFPVPCPQHKPLYSVPWIPIVLGWWRRFADNWEAFYFLPLCCSHILFLKNSQRLSCRNSPADPLLYHVLRKAATKGWPAASASSTSLCIQSLVPLPFLYSGAPLACHASLWPSKWNCSARPACACLLYETSADCFIPSWSSSLLPLENLPCGILCCFPCVSVGSHSAWGKEHLWLTCYMHGTQGCINYLQYQDVHIWLISG